MTIGWTLCYAPSRRPSESDNDSTAMSWNRSANASRRSCVGTDILPFTAIISTSRPTAPSRSASIWSCASGPSASPRTPYRSSTRTDSIASTRCVSWWTAGHTLQIHRPYSARRPTRCAFVTWRSVTLRGSICFARACSIGAASCCRAICLMNATPSGLTLRWPDWEPCGM